MAVYQEANIQALGIIAETLLWRYNGTRPDGSTMVVYCANQNLWQAVQKIDRAFFSEILRTGLGSVWIGADDLQYAIKAAGKKKLELSKSFRKISEYVERNKTIGFSRKFPLRRIDPQGQRVQSSNQPKYSRRHAAIADGQRVLAQALE